MVLPPRFDVMFKPLHEGFLKSAKKPKRFGKVFNAMTPLLEMESETFCTGMAKWARTCKYGQDPLRTVICVLEFWVKLFREVRRRGYHREAERFCKGAIACLRAHLELLHRHPWAYTARFELPRRSKEKKRAPRFDVVLHRGSLLAVVSSRPPPSS